MTTAEINEQIELLQAITYKSEQSFYKLNTFINDVIALIRLGSDQVHWDFITTLENHKENIKRRKSIGVATFEKHKDLILKDLEIL